MRPVLFHIPVSLVNSSWSDIPIYGYGLMLFLAFLACNWLGQRLARRQGIDPKFIPDLVIWLFVSGIIGGRIVFIATKWEEFQRAGLWKAVALWDGGLVLYGALFGAMFGYFGYHQFVMRKAGVSHWPMLDVMAPCIALGIAMGRIGCLCTGCCFGNVACASAPYPVHFAYGTAPAPTVLTARGLQTPFGFVLGEHSLLVEAVEPGTPAEDAGLQADDILIQINDKPIRRQEDLARAETPFKLTVFRDGAAVTLRAFTPTSLGLHPTQVYETISMGLLLFFLLSYFPYRRRDGEMMVLLMIGYGVHRYLNEMLRTDTDPVAFGLTLSQNISVGILAAGAILGVAVWKRTPRAETPPWVEPPPDVPANATAPPESLGETKS